MDANPLLAIVTRAGRAESLHRGIVAVATATRLLFNAGATLQPVFPRSALKPFQALPLLEDGLHERLGLDDRELALTTASHGGDERHVEAALSLLAKGEVPESALRCGAHRPMDEQAARRLETAGREPCVLHHNCSGKHAGMLIQARHLGAPLEGYVDPAHPVQRRIAQRIAAFAGVEAASLGTAVDGCSAPAFALPLPALARAYARFADPAALPAPTAAAARRLFDAAVAQPHFVSGRRRFDLAVTRASGSRTFCKGGAEGVFALAIRPPRPGLESVGVAIKVDDGNPRGAWLPLLALLRWLGFDPPAAADDLARAMGATLMNDAGLEVGKIEVADTFARLPPSPWS